MKLLPSRLLVAVAFLLLVRGVSPLVAQQVVPDAKSAPTMPDPKLTPGDVLPVGLADIQVKGYSSKVRNVPIEVKRQVYASYGIAHWVTGQYEVDHLIPLSLGGSNSTKNLWPESYLTSPWNAHTKDALEDKLLSLVRSGKVDLHQAQQEIAANWITAYKKYVSPTPLAARKSATSYEPDTETASPASASPAATPIATVAGNTKVWVNTRSGVIWKPGSQYYGKTKQGKYMSEADALKAGYHEPK